MACERLAGKNVIVWLLCSSKTPLCFLYGASSLEPLARSLTRMAESRPDSKSTSVRLISAVSVMDWERFVIIRSIDFGSCPVYLSYGDYLLAGGFILSANKITESPVVSFWIVIFLFALSLSLIVLINLLNSPSPYDLGWDMLGDLLAFYHKFIWIFCFGIHWMDPFLLLVVFRALLYIHSKIRLLSQHWVPEKFRFWPAILMVYWT